MSGPGRCHRQLKVVRGHSEWSPHRNPEQPEVHMDKSKGVPR
jgi:hypothetical protein